MAEHPDRIRPSRSRSVTPLPDALHLQLAPHILLVMNGLLDVVVYQNL